MVMNNTNGLSMMALFQKRSFDLLFSLIGLFVFWWLILLSALLARIDTGMNGFFTQQRVGCYGKLFKVIKIRTMKIVVNLDTTVTAADDVRITALGRFFRRTKIDELPQFINVFLGQMSFVGPRPDVPGYADRLEGDDRGFLMIRPGITGPASLKYKYEEDILAAQPDPKKYNDEVIWPDKIRINREYIENYSFPKDLYYIWKTIVG